MSKALEAERKYVDFLPLDYDPCKGCRMHDPTSCDLHPSFPSYLRIDTKLPLYGSVKPYVRHIVIATGHADWKLSHVEEDKSSLAGMLYNLQNPKVQPAIESVLASSPTSPVHTSGLGSGRSTPANSDGKNTPVRSNTPTRRLKKAEMEQEELREAEMMAHKVAESVGKPRSRIIFTNGSNSPSEYTTLPGATDVLIFPDMIAVHNVKIEIKDATRFKDVFLTKETGTRPSYLDTVIASNQKIMDIGGFKVSPLAYKAIILICGHMRRDKRCGVTGPILQAEFIKYLKELDLNDDKRYIEAHGSERVAVHLVSHVGGHKFAGNVIVYLSGNDGRLGQGIWYGRVTPHHVKAVVDETVLHGKIISQLYRGGLPEGANVLDF